MASDSQTATATMSEKPLENKVNEEANLMEKEIVLPETVDVVNVKLVSDSNLKVVKEEQIDQSPAGEPEKVIPSEVEEAAAVVKAEESTDKGKCENGEKKVLEQVEPKEPTLVKEVVAEVNVQAVDEEKSEAGKGKDENGEEKVAEQVELKEPTLVKESVDAEKAEEKLALENVAEEENKDTEEEKMVDVSESTDEAEGKQVEPVDVQLVREVSEETVDVEVLAVEPKPDTSEKAEAQPEKTKELAPEAVVVRTEDTPETTEQAKVELEASIVETKDSAINSKDAQTYGSGSALCPKETVPINQDSDTAPIKETEGEASSLPDVIEKTITEEKQEPSKHEKENVSEEARGVVTKLATEDGNITRDTETPTAEEKSGETLKETDTESTEGNKQGESITEKVAEVVEAATVVQEIDELKQEPEVTTKEVAIKPKHSNSIMSKVKQSLVKAKKAIIGKSPSSKTITTEETKEEIIAK